TPEGSWAVATGEARPPKADKRNPWSDRSRLFSPRQGRRRPDTRRVIVLGRESFLGPPFLGNLFP
ncbi:MAG: hypothetical protein ACE5EQ_04695, partial [Phycisphaerae bacterium]